MSECLTLEQLQTEECARRKLVRDTALAVLHERGEAYSRDVWLALPSRRFISCAFVQQRLAAMQREGRLTVRLCDKQDRRGWLRNYYRLVQEPQP